MVAGFKPIEKEEIVHLKFPHTDVLENDIQISERKQQIERALSLGNLEHLKLKIFFQDNSHKFVSETTVWDTTNDQIILKKGVVIPINRIIKIV